MDGDRRDGTRPLGIRWTIGDVSAHGWEALRLSIHGAYRVFGANARYLVCVNSVPLDEARSRVGEIPKTIEWRDVTHELDPLIRQYLDEGLAEGVGWKFAPLRVFADRYELALDNDCILWAAPRAVHEWLHGVESGTCVIAEDIRPCFGQFADLCGSEPRNSGIRGIPPSFDLRSVLIDLLSSRAAPLKSELDEQGLQVAALRSSRPIRVVRLEEVSICSPFPPHCAHLGTCGAHFVGLNAHRFPWNLDDGRNASVLTREHFEHLRPELYRRIGL
jgi:hypothetical protein